MSAQDLIVKWEEALVVALMEQPLESELPDRDLRQSRTALRVKTDLRTGTAPEDCITITACGIFTYGS